MRRTLGVAAVLLLALSIAQSASSVRTRSVLLQGYDTFRAGEMDGVALEQDGIVLPGLESETLGTGMGAQVWCLLRARNGSLYCGTGSEGSVFRIDPGGAVSLTATFEYEVFAIAEGGRGEIYAAGAPNGTIVKIEGQEPHTFFDTPEKIVWALLTDAQGNLYAATGDRGCLYKIDPKGEARVLYRAKDNHLVCLAWSADGKLLAGTEGQGLLLEIDPGSGSGRVLFDAPFTGITQIVVAPNKWIYFAASAAAAGPPGIPGSGEAAGESTQPEATGPIPSRLFVREADGAIRTVWDSKQETIHSLALDGDRGLLVGTGNEAGLYRVSWTGEATMIWKLRDEGQVLALRADGEAVLAGTGNPGTVHRLGPGRSKTAWIRPRPIALPSMVTWGRAIWEVLPGAGRWELRTRSGYTEQPDSSWSAWSAALIEPTGSPILSPPGSFLQCEARYLGGGTGEAAGLRQIWIPHAERNLPPQVRGVRLSAEEFLTNTAGLETTAYTEDLGGGLQVSIERTTPPNNGAAPDAPPPWVRDVRSIVWTADDPNGDLLVYDVELRRVGEETFRSLVREHRLAAYAVDTRTLPEGSYEVRVVASDAPSNPPDDALESEKVGGPFRVDHRRPQIVDLTARRTSPLQLVVEGKAVDSVSPIRVLEVSWDGRSWRPVAPLDTLLDSPEEAFRAEIALQDEEEGSWAAIRVIDAAGNETIESVWLDK